MDQYQLRRCPACNRTYADEMFNFCPVDGSPLARQFHENIVLPKLSPSADKVTIRKWLKAVGDRVQKSEPLVEVDTDKAVMEMQAPCSGILTEILIADGQTVPFNTLIGRIRHL